MLESLSIKNYALIDALQLNFKEGFSVITGETGAGKSILLGALALVLGKRADLTSLRNKGTKCVVEATFDLSSYQLTSFFREHHIDFEIKTILRREILPSGKSRAFINDGLINLAVLQKLGVRLIDIHSQHQTLELIQETFQLAFVDVISNNSSVLKSYRTKFSHYKMLCAKLKELEKMQLDSNKQADYNHFLYQELEEANLDGESLETLETTYATLNGIEQIKEQLSQSYQLLGREKLGVIDLLSETKQHISNLQVFGEPYQKLYQRVNSLWIELDDIYTEIQQVEEQLVDDPKTLSEVNERLQLLYHLQKKHTASNVEELLEIKNKLHKKLELNTSLEEEINSIKIDIQKLEKELIHLAELLKKNRLKAIPVVKKKLESVLSTLGMPNATFEITLKSLDQLSANGLEELEFLFSANKGGLLSPLKKVASGGELSRIMLTIKSILAGYTNLPTIIFDEIDTGVSGEISQKMAEIMEQMGKNRQVLSITHLPQVAAKGEFHFKVYKNHDASLTETNVILLNQEERIMELAEMLGGKNFTQSAVVHAKQLLN